MTATTSSKQFFNDFIKLNYCVANFYATQYVIILKDKVNLSNLIKEVIKMLEMTKAITHGMRETIETGYELTIEQIMEIDEYHKQGKEHPLESKMPSIKEMRAKIGRYGLQAEEYLMYHNYPKYTLLQARMTLEKELLAIDEKVETFRNKRIQEYIQPKESYLEKVNHLREYQMETEELIFEEIIKPFAKD